MFLPSNIAIILYFVNFYRHVGYHEKKEKTTNACSFINKILCIYILLFHGGHDKDFPSLSSFNPSIYLPIIATPRFLTFYLIAFPPSIQDSRKCFMHMFKCNAQLKFLHLFLLEIIKQYVKHYHTFFHELNMLYGLISTLFSLMLYDNQ